MLWIQWLTRLRARRICVVGLDFGTDYCSLVVLSGLLSQPDSVCCSERLNLPNGLVERGKVLQSELLGKWLRTYLAEGNYQPTLAYIGLDDSYVSNHFVTVVEGLSTDHLVSHLKNGVQSLLPVYAGEVLIDYVVDCETVIEGKQCYLVKAAQRCQVEALQRVVLAAGLIAAAVEPRQDAARRMAISEVLKGLPQASVALALQCDEAFGLALRAWSNQGVNFLPCRKKPPHLLRYSWLLGITVSILGASIVAAIFALVTSSDALSIAGLHNP